MFRAITSLLLLHYAAAIFDSDVYSVFYDLNTIPDNVRLSKKCMIYIGSNSEEAQEERNYQLISPKGSKISVVDASKNLNTDGTLKPVFEEAVDEFSISHKGKYDFYEPAIIYAVEEGADNHVVVSKDTAPTKIDLNGTSIHDTYVTVLSPKKHTTLTSLNGSSIFQMAWLTLSAGGAKEARMEDFQLLDLGKMMGEFSKGLLLLEPVVTVRQTASLPGSISMNVISKDFRKAGNAAIEIDVDWGDTVVAMSSGYKLEKEHAVSYQNLQYVFKAKHNNTQFDVEFSGDIYNDAAITFRKRGYDGVGIQGFSEKVNLQKEQFTFKGEQLQLMFDIIADKQVENRHSNFFSIINVGKSASNLLFTLVPTLLLFIYFS